MDEASKTAKLSPDDAEDSDGCSSSEEDTALPASSTKAMQIIQDQEHSPSPKRVTEPEKEKAILTSQSPNNKSKTGIGSVNPNYKSTKSTQNKSIINLKTINSGMEPASKNNSPRKSEGGKNQGFFRETIG